MPRIIAILFLSLTAAQVVQAAAITPQQGQQVVSGWLKAHAQPMTVSPGGRGPKVEPFTDADGQTVCYIVHLAPAGFAIVPADDAIEPIIGFSAGGAFDGSADSPLAALLRKDLPRRLAALKVAGGNAAVAWQQTVAEARWRRFSDPPAAATPMPRDLVPDMRVAPLVQSRWGQYTVCDENCFNYYTPDNSVCGCVATAMVQLMRFWQHPAAGIGVHPFTIYYGTSMQDARALTAWTRGGDGTGGPYDWAQMPLVPDCTLTELQRQAIGALCYDAGLSVHMIYSPLASGAYSSQVNGAFVGTFGYANAVWGASPIGELGEAVYAMANPCLDAGMPCLLGIWGTAGGHAIVVDGYGYDSSTPYHHLNMGWDGMYDVWYNLPNVSVPGAPFEHNDECIYNIHPFIRGEIISGRVFDRTGGVLDGVRVTARAADDSTFTATTNAQGIYALVGLSSASNYIVTGDKGGFAFAWRSETTGTSVSGELTTGNRWGVDLVAGDPQPPTAMPGEVQIEVDTAVTVVLHAADDGLPNPPASLTYVITSLPDCGSLRDPMGGDINTVPYGLIGGGRQVAYVPATGYKGSDAFQFKASDSGLPPEGGDSPAAVVTIEIRCPLYHADMDRDPGWTLEPGWAWGAPTGGGSRNRDPSSGHTGANVIGYNLAGDYGNSMPATRYATTPAIDCRGYRDVKLEFYRWLGVEAAGYDRASIQVSHDGSTWVETWTNPSVAISDDGWQRIECDISAVADNQPAVYIRWGMGPTDESISFPGWNIDDVRVTGVATMPPAPCDPDPPDGAANISASPILSWKTAPGPFRLLASTGGQGRIPYCLLELQIEPVNQTLIGPSGYLAALDASPDGVIYGATDTLYLVDADSGALTTIGQIHSEIASNIEMTGIAFDPGGRLYGLSYDGDLYMIDRNTASATWIGTPGEILWGIDFSPDGTLYAAEYDLVTLDPGSGQVLSRIGSLPGDVVDIDFAPDGFLYGLDFENVGRLYRIRPDIGEVSPVADYGEDFWALASISVAANASLAVTYNVYFGTSDPPAGQLACGLSVPACDPGQLQPEAVYYWRVVTTNAVGQTEGPVWSFTVAGPGLIGDINGDGVVDVVDLLYFLDAFGAVHGDPNYDPRCDFNGDGSVDVVDLLTLVENFGT